MTKYFLTHHMQKCGQKKCSSNFSFAAEHKYMEDSGRQFFFQNEENTFGPSIAIF